MHSTVKQTGGGQQLATQSCIRRGGGGPQGCIRTERASEVAPEAVRQAVGGGCRSGWGRLLSVTNAIEPGTWRQGDSGWARGWVFRAVSFPRQRGPVAGVTGVVLVAAVVLRSLLPTPLRILVVHPLPRRGAVCTRPQCFTPSARCTWAWRARPRASRAPPRAARAPS